MAYTIIAHTGAGSTNGGTSVTSTAINTTSANEIIVHVAYYVTGGSLTDSNTNTWIPLTQHGATFSRFFYCYAPTVGSSHSFTWTSSGGTSYPAIDILAVNGSTSSPFDVENGSSSASPGSITPGSNNELVVCGMASLATTVISIDSGMTISDSQAYSPGQNVGGGLAYIIQTTAGAISPTWSGITNPGTSIASFKAGASAVSTVQYRSLLGVGI